MSPEMVKRRLTLAEGKLLLIDSLFSDNERPSQIVSEYFNEVNNWLFEDENKNNK